VLREVAYQAALVMAELHATDYLFPDLHGEQFLVAPGKKLVLIDTASVQFEENGKVYACTRVRDEYQAPEFTGTTDWQSVAGERDMTTDAWSLAVLIFQLAMGCHPFFGVYVAGQGQGLSPAERARQGFFPFDKSCRDYRPPPAAPPYGAVPQELRNLFYRTFVEGHTRAERHRRATAAEWADVLRYCPALRNDGPAQATFKPVVKPAPRPHNRRETVQAITIGILAFLVLTYGLSLWLDESTTSDKPPSSWERFHARSYGRHTVDAERVIRRLLATSDDELATTKQEAQP
jgi:hypothetical protein